MLVKFKHVSYIYNPKTPFETKALNDLNLDLYINHITAVVGKTGSGKSTLSQLINKLLTPTKGEVVVDNLINSSTYKIKHKMLQSFRKQVGFLFQQAENQLFESTVLKDVMFGIKAFYPKSIDHEQRAKEALRLVGLDESFDNRSPFDLSGGEKKRVAIAGVIAYHPKLLILDEPTAGLDATSSTEIMELFKKIHSTGVAIILVTHDMDLVLKYADQMIVMDEGEIKCLGTPIKILSGTVEHYHLSTPFIYQVTNALLKRNVHIDINQVTDISSFIEAYKHHG